MGTKTTASELNRLNLRLFVQTLLQSQCIKSVVQPLALDPLSFHPKCQFKQNFSFITAMF